MNLEINRNETLKSDKKTRLSITKLASADKLIPGDILFNFSVRLLLHCICCYYYLSMFNSGLCFLVLESHDAVVPNLHIAKANYKFLRLYYVSFMYGQIYIYVIISIVYWRCIVRMCKVKKKLNVCVSSCWWNFEARLFCIYTINASYCTKPCDRK